MTAVRRLGWLVAGLLASGLAGCSGGGGAEGSCAAPMPALSPGSAAPGQQVRVQIDFPLSCPDTNDTATPGQPNRWVGVAVTMTQGGKDVVLATVDADAAGHLDVTVLVPKDAAPGPATIHANSTDNAPITVLAG